MRLLAFIPIKLTLLLILGILIGHQFSFEPLYLLCSTCILLAILTVVFISEKNSTSYLFGLITALTFISLGAYCQTRAQPIHHSKHYSKISLEPKTLLSLKIKEVLKPTLYTNRYFALINSINKETSTGTILISIPTDSFTNNLKIDDELITYGTLQEIKPPLNPHQFSFKKYLKNLGIYHQLSIEQNTFIKAKKPKQTLLGIASKARTHIIEKLKQANFGDDELGVIQALLLGERSSISEETYTNYQKAGAVHILAVSGLHIGILLLLIQFLLGPLKYIPNGSTVILILSVVFLWAFAFLAGLSASIIRATTMFSFVAYALYLNRPSNSFNILALSVLFILLFIDPNLLFQVGFQMSYAAVFAILWIYPLLQKFWFPKHKIVRYFWQLLSVSIAAQLGVLPISLFYFHQFPGLFFISNLLIIPALGVILSVGILVIFLSLINWLPTQLVWAYNELIKLMNSIISWVAQQESFVFSSISFDFTQLIISFIALFLLINAFKRPNFKPIAFFLLSIICFQGYTLFNSYTTSNKEEVIVLHRNRNSIILNRNGKNLTVLSSKPNNIGSLINDFKTGERITTVRYDSLKNSYIFKNDSFHIIDSTAIFDLEEATSRILLTQSPKVNLERIIATNKPTQIIADGSNYKSYVDRWRLTCIKNKIPFHYTGEKGAYFFE